MVSKKPKTQRRLLYATSLHSIHSLMNVHISKDLRKKLGVSARSFSLRKGDRVRVMRGSHKGKTGKITKVDLKGVRAYVEGIVSRKAKGEEVPVPFIPSNLLMLDGGFDDKWRKRILARKKTGVD